MAALSRRRCWLRNGRWWGRCLRRGRATLELDDCDHDPGNGWDGDSPELVVLEERNRHLCLRGGWRVAHALVPARLVHLFAREIAARFVADLGVDCYAGFVVGMNHVQVSHDGKFVELVELQGRRCRRWLATPRVNGPRRLRGGQAKKTEAYLDPVDSGKVVTAVRARLADKGNGRGLNRVNGSAL
jgi:hypothetical protein